MSSSGRSGRATGLGAARRYCRRIVVGPTGSRRTDFRGRVRRQLARGSLSCLRSAAWIPTRLDDLCQRARGENERAWRGTGSRPGRPPERWSTRGRPRASADRLRARAESSAYRATAMRTDGNRGGPDLPPAGHGAGCRSNERSTRTHNRQPRPRWTGHRGPQPLEKPRDSTSAATDATVATRAAMSSRAAYADSPPRIDLRHVLRE